MNTFKSSYVTFIKTIFFTKMCFKC